MYLKSIYMRMSNRSESTSEHSLGATLSETGSLPGNPQAEEPDSKPLLLSGRAACPEHAQVWAEPQGHSHLLSQLSEGHAVN